MWKINNTDITATFGAYLKRGSYDSLMLYPTMKEYVTEDIREEHGERVSVQMKKVKARDVTLAFYIVAQKEDFNRKYEAFLFFLMQAGTFSFELTKQNRTFRLRYNGGVTRRELRMRGDGTYYCEVSVSFRQDNPFDVTEGNFLLHEDGLQDIITEGGEQIGGSFNVYTMQ